MFARWGVREDEEEVGQDFKEGIAFHTAAVRAVALVAFRAGAGVRPCSRRSLRLSLLPALLACCHIPHPSDSAVLLRPTRLCGADVVDERHGGRGAARGREGSPRAPGGQLPVVALSGRRGCSLVASRAPQYLLSLCPTPLSSDAVGADRGALEVDVAAPQRRLGSLRPARPPLPLRCPAAVRRCAALLPSCLVGRSVGCGRGGRLRDSLPGLRRRWEGRRRRGPPRGPRASPSEPLERPTPGQLLRPPTELSRTGHSGAARGGGAAVVLPSHPSPSLPPLPSPSSLGGPARLCGGAPPYP